MKKFVLFIILSICINATAQVMTLEVQYSTGLKDSILFGFDKYASPGIDADYNEVNIYGESLKPFDLRCIQRTLDSSTNCRYEVVHNENIDTKINFRKFKEHDRKSRVFEFVLNSPDNEFDIKLKSSSIYLEKSGTVYPDSCKIGNYPFEFQIEGKFTEVDIKPLIQFSGFSQVKYIIISIDHLGGVSTMDQEISELAIFPNPANSFVNINNGELNIQEITLLDFSGKTILNEKLHKRSSYKLNLPAEMDGLYLIKIRLENNEIVTRKLLVE